MIDSLGGEEPEFPSLYRVPLAGSRAFDLAWAHFAKPIASMARRLGEDPDLRSDLVQEAMIALWQLDTSRIDMREPTERAYVWRALMNKMLDARRWAGRRVDLTDGDAGPAVALPIDLIR
jgi:DNA-directed RNA polymerase specialized sigma24 family protein